MVGSEGPWPNRSNTPGFEKGNWASQSYNGYQPPYTNSPHVQHPMDPNPENIPIPSIEDDPPRKPRRIVFVLPNASDHHLDKAEAGIPKAPSVTNFPCVVFASVGAMNIAIGIGTLLLVCVSEKMRKVSNFSSIVFVIISAIGFGTAMGACNFLQQKSGNDLWQWACNQEHAGHSDPGKPQRTITPDFC
ncbi:hypothetical protein V490_07558 [Pseudogymnoascus sp. VKM F-3557]|nr:hypothetical protein V490_07558 [Pseudogymnoascus sp. VKM F-3557]